MKEIMIPKIIHYCWFGGKPLPDTALKCIASWRKYCPDYTIKEWNETNYDVNKICYTAQAYQAKKYAFVSDYARFDILYEYGGIYFDTDVELIKPIDSLIEEGPFAGIESPGALAAGLGLSSRQRETIFSDILESYSQSCFFRPDGSMDLTTVVVRVSDIFKRYGFTAENKIQTVKGITIYPVDYFNPKNPKTGELKITANTYSIHHFDASGLEDWQLNIKHYNYQLNKKNLPSVLKKLLSNIYHISTAFGHLGLKKGTAYLMSKVKK